MGRTRGADTPHKKCRNFSRFCSVAAEITRDQSYGFFSCTRTGTEVLVHTKDKRFRRVSSRHRTGLRSANSRKLHTFCYSPRVCRTPCAASPLRTLHNTPQESYWRRWNLTSQNVSLRPPRLSQATTSERQISTDHSDLPVSRVGAGSAWFFPCTRGDCADEDGVTYILVGALFSRRLRQGGRAMGGVGPVMCTQWSGNTSARSLTH